MSKSASPASSSAWDPGATLMSTCGEVSSDPWIGEKLSHWVSFISWKL